MIADYIRDAISRGSIIRVMFERGKKLKDTHGSEQVYDLTLGNPVLEPPQEYFDALRELSELRHASLHRYMSNVGFDFVRQNIADYLVKNRILPGVTKENIVMTAGAASAINIILKAIINPGDEVIIFAPYFVEYIHYVAGHKGEVVIVNTKNDFMLDLELLEQKISPKTKAIIINYPNNPSGRIYPQADLAAFVDLLNRKQTEYNSQIALISDEPYRELVFDNLDLPSVAAMYDNSFIVYSWSKSLSIPGDRIGYIAFNPRFQTPRMLDALSFCLRLLGFVNASASMQWIVNKLLDVSIDLAYYEEKRNRIYQTLTSAGYEIHKPEGTFYIFAKAPNGDSLHFTQKALQERILVVPGAGFGWPTHFRIAFCTHDKIIDGALDGLVRIIRS